MDGFTRRVAGAVLEGRSQHPELLPHQRFGKWTQIRWQSEDVTVTDLKSAPKSCLAVREHVSATEKREVSSEALIK